MSAALRSFVRWSVGAVPFVVVVGLIPVSASGQTLRRPLSPASRPAATRPAPPKPAASAPAFRVRDAVEVKWGGLWSKAVVKNKSPDGAWTLVEYEGRSSYEWVEPWRLRKPGSDVEVPHARPNASLRKPEPPPKTPPDPMPSDDAAAVGRGRGDVEERARGAMRGARGGRSDDAAANDPREAVAVYRHSSWDDARVVKRQEAWTLVEYEWPNRKEWVEPWRVRKSAAAAGGADPATGAVADGGGEGGGELPMVWPNPDVSGDEPPPTPQPVPWPGPDVRSSRAEDRRSLGEKLALEADPAYKRMDAGAAPKVTLHHPVRKAYVPVAGSSTFRLAAPLRLKGPPGAGPRVRPALFPPNESGTAAVGGVAYLPDAGARHVELIDGTAGASRGVYALPPGGMPDDVAPDGRTVAVVIKKSNGAGGQDCVEVMAVPDGDGGALRRTLVFHPFDAAEWHERDVTHAQFVGPDRLLTRGRGGQVVVWDLGAGRALWSMEGNVNRQAVLDRSRRFVAFAEFGRAGVFETATGTCVARFEPGTSLLESMAFSPSGRYLLGVRQGQTVLRYDLTDPSAAPAEVTIPGKVASLLALDERYVLLDGVLLLDLEVPAVVWRCEVPKDVTAEVVPSGLVYAIVGADASAVRTFDVLTPAVRAASTGADAAAARLLGPGDAVTVEDQLGGVDAGARQQILDGIRQRLAERRITVADGRPVRLVLTSTPGQTREHTYTGGGAGVTGPQKRSVTEQVNQVAMYFEGKPVWAWSSTFSGAGFLQGKTIDEGLENARRDALAGLGHAPLPRVVLRPQDPWGAGVTRFTGEGPVEGK